MTLSTITMFSATTGWAETPYMCAVRTINGGATWRDTTPGAIIEGGYPACSTYFLSPNDAWIVFLEADHFATVYRTSDGGRTWSASPRIPTKYGDGGAELDFVDANHGWLVIISTGHGQLPGQLFHTVDGGATWSEVSSTGKDTGGHLPFGSEQVWFTDASHGWIVGTPGAGRLTERIWLYRTTDGGTTWVHEELLIPHDAPSGIVSIIAQQPFGRMSGALTVTFGGKDSTLYATQDGGVTWHLVGPTPAGQGAVDFVSAQDGWFAGPRYLYRTTDGGSIWSEVNTFPLAPGVPGGKAFHTIDFVNTHLGWALVTEATANSSTWLLATNDGGRTWRTVTWRLINRPGGA